MYVLYNTYKYVHSFSNKSRDKLIFARPTNYTISSYYLQYFKNRPFYKANLFILVVLAHFKPFSRDTLHYHHHLPIHSSCSSIILESTVLVKRIANITNLVNATNPAIIVDFFALTTIAISFDQQHFLGFFVVVIQVYPYLPIRSIGNGWLEKQY